MKVKIEDITELIDIVMTSPDPDPGVEGVTAIICSAADIALGLTQEWRAQTEAGNHEEAALTLKRSINLAMRVDLLLNKWLARTHQELEDELERRKMN